MEGLFVWFSLKSRLYPLVMRRSSRYNTFIGTGGGAMKITNITSYVHKVFFDAFCQN